MAYADQSEVIETESFWMSGSAGSLEAILTKTTVSQAAMVLCHPHPQMGGNMDDLVVDQLQRAGLSLGIDCLKFNFRGAGESEGHHDGKLEWQDVLTAFSSLPESKPRLIAGYSFGAVMGLKASHEISHLDGLILVAPPLQMLSEVVWPACPVMLISGDQDQWVEPGLLTSISGQQENVEVNVISGANHFFQGHHSQLSEITSETLQKWMRPRRR